MHVIRDVDSAFKQQETASRNAEKKTPTVIVLFLNIFRSAFGNFRLSF